MQKTSEKKVVYCSECGKEIDWSHLTKNQKTVYRRSQHAYCCEECKKEFLRKLSSKTMTETNKKYANVISERMKKNNPMKNEETRQKMADSLKRINHAPKIRGGNGTGLTEPQKKLKDALEDLNPSTEFIVRTGVRKINPEHLPSHYKLDIGIPDYLVCVEVDGGSHCSLKRKEQDRKKTDFLISKGWTVLRFSNAEVMEETDKCLETIMSTISKLKD